MVLVERSIARQAQALVLSTAECGFKSQSLHCALEQGTNHNCSIKGWEVVFCSTSQAPSGLYRGNTFSVLGVGGNVPMETLAYIFMDCKGVPLFQPLKKVAMCPR